MAYAKEELEKLELPPLRHVICREDLPENPKWREYGYPDPHCWDIDELFLEAAKSGECSPLWHDARRIYWEAIHRAWGTYRRGRPFFDVYWCDVRKKVCWRDTSPSLVPSVIAEIISAAMTFGIGRPGAGVLREFFGPPVRKAYERYQERLKV